MAGLAPGDVVEIYAAPYISELDLRDLAPFISLSRQAIRTRTLLWALRIPTTRQSLAILYIMFQPRG